MSIPLPSERLSSLSFWVSEFLHSPELCDRSLSLLVELALLPSPRGFIYEHAAPFWVFEFPHSEEWFLCSPELLMGRASTAPLTTEGHLWACRSLMGIWVPSHSEEWVLRPPELVLVELALLPSLRGSPTSMLLSSEHLSFPLILTNEFSALQSSVIGRSPCWSS